MHVLIFYDKPMEFPTVNRKQWTKPYRYGYSIVVDEVNSSPKTVNRAGGGIYKYDLQTGEMDAWLSNDEIPGEPFFVAAQESKGGEDEGYLHSFSYDKNLSLIHI